MAVAIYSSSSGQAFSNGGAQTQLLYGTSVYDPDSLVSNAASDWAFTAPSTGAYYFSGFLYWVSASRTGLVEMNLKVNGTLRATIGARDLAMTYYEGFHGGGAVSLTAADVVKLYITSYATGTLTCYTGAEYNQVSVFKVS